MIGNHFSWGSSGYTILEEGEIEPGTLQLRVDHYLVCRPDGSTLPGTWTLAEAKSRIEALERED